MYPLLKHLKDSGFPQKDGMYVQPDGGAISKNIIVNFSKFAYNPTTDELIEELGYTRSGKVSGEVYFLSLWWDDLTERWLAGYRSPTASGAYLNVGTGSTPKEALINLYIEIHDKTREMEKQE